MNIAWTKTDIKIIAQTLKSHHLERRLYVDGDKLRSAVLKDAARIAKSHLLNWAENATKEATNHTTTAEHYRDHFKDLSMHERFSALAKESAKSAAKAKVLAEKIGAHGIPAEAVEIYRTTAL